MSVMQRMWGAVWVACLAGYAAGFNGHVASEGAVTVTISPVEDVTAFDVPRRVDVTVENKGAAAVTVALRMGGLVDEWRAVGATDRQVVVAGGSREAAAFEIACGQGAPSALWPVHVWADFELDGQARSVHCVQVFKSAFVPVQAEAPSDPAAAVVPARGALSLLSVDTHRVVWQFFDEAPVAMPVGWQGSEERSRTSFGIGDEFRGARRRALQIHPPWYGKAGTVFVEYRVTLPETRPIALRFANAIRDSGPQEPASDGVTFRVWVGDEKRFDRHTDSKTWLDGEADLSDYAGKTVLLRLESHPGPKKNTTCDSCFWGDPVIMAGDPPKRLTAEQKVQLGRQAGRLVSGKPHLYMSDSPEVVVGGKASLFPLADGCIAAVLPGPNGIFDAAIAFGKGDKCVVFDGVNAAVLGSRIGADSEVLLESIEMGQDGKMMHRLSHGGEQFDLTAILYAEHGGLRIRFECPQRITDLAIGRADQKAPRVYYGHGYCIEEPKAFRAGFGGHNLSTSHVGFDFAGGVSLLMATDNPPDALEVSPDEHVYALHTHMNATLTFVPGLSGAFDCAVKYRDLYDKKPSPGFKNKAGRFVFDIWGGGYAYIAETMQRMIDYGLTDSLLTVHNWQRWGYDYRLPDIYPPNPRYGTIGDMRKIGELCRPHAIPWGLHDNYIDFYPDAEGYSYDHICFTERGEPVKAWINEDRDAQSYRWRPDRFMPFLQRNLKLIKEGLAPTHYFIDVFTSIELFDFYDKAGDFHSMLETRRCWGESFRWIQDYLGGAVTTSEAGHDQLTGYLDGADCQHLTLTPQSREFCIRLECGDWQRVPWFDAVLHDKFSLHGVGYPSRYVLTEPDDHGGVLESDDYISAEVLTGHAMMIDNRGFGRGAVRKYWLAQDFLRSIATDTIRSVQFADDDIHRQIVTWSGGARVYVNRGKDDWNIAGKTLPQYGYFAANGEIASSIERIDGIIVEQSQGPSGRYFNGRGFDAGDRLGLRPRIDRAEYLGGRGFRLVVDWDVVRPASKALSVFLHFSREESSRRDKIAFQGDLNPALPMTAWKDRITTGADRTIAVPADCPPGSYEIGIGVWDPSTGKRYPLIGDDDGSTRYILGTLVVEGDDDRITNVKVIAHSPKPAPPSRRNANNIAVDFGPVVTAGAVRCVLKEDSLIVTPLPEMDAFDVAVRTAQWTDGRGMKPKGVVVIDAAGADTRGVRFDVKGDAATFQTRKGEFGYRLTLSDR
ncbi:MAG: hypothetical protein IH624_06245 [Phycisphaerae bacterium]|nr:hypothetical protein [Phycisphaerae bacterium]